uniref:Uncharacterized protein n=1 Tax=Human herpesvirus 1 TaxID=10298 RepID=A0A2U9A9X6_HHV1|nr:hypothetical protein [Human alphaherpesvirus 1]AWO71259.1 hypothetical protein [Human alphaherpesvirus 1]
MRSRSRAGASRCRRRPLRRPSATPAPGPRAPQPLPSLVAGAVCGRRSRRAFMCAGETRPPPPGPAPGAGAESGTAPVLALRPNNIYILGRSANASRSHFFYPAAPPPWGGPARRPMGGRQGGRPLGRPPSRWSRRPAGGTGGPGDGQRARGARISLPPNREVGARAPPPARSSLACGTEAETAGSGGNEMPCGAGRGPTRPRAPPMADGADGRGRGFDQRAAATGPRRAGVGAGSCIMEFRSGWARRGGGGPAASAAPPSRRPLGLYEPEDAPIVHTERGCRHGSTTRRGTARDRPSDARRAGTPIRGRSAGGGSAVPVLFPTQASTGPR